MISDIKKNKQQVIREFEFLSPIVDFVTGFTNITDEMRSEEAGIACSVTNVKIDLPIEMGIKVDDNGKVNLASAPPTQQIETTIFPVLHRMRLSLVVENGSKAK